MHVRVGVVELNYYLDRLPLYVNYYPKS